MAGLLDLDQQQNQGGLLGLLNAIPQAATQGGLNGQPPALDPYIQALAGQQALDAARQNYARNVQAGMAQVARQGGSLADLMSAPGAAAGGQYSSEVQQAAKDAMFLRQLRMMENMGGQGSDPFQQLQQGAMWASMGLPGGQNIQDAARAQINEPVLALHNARLARAQGDSDAAASYYIQFLKATGRLNIADRSGTMTLLGGVTPGDLQYISVNPQSGTITGPSSQGALPGAAATKQKLATAEAYGSHAADIVPVETGSGNTQQMTNPAARAALGGGAAPAGAVPAPPRPAAAAPAATPSAAAFPLISNPQMRDAVNDTGYLFNAPAPQAGRSLTPDQQDTLKDVAKSRTELKEESDAATQGAATTLTYIKAAQDVLKGGAPTGLSAQVQAGFSRALAAAGLSNGTAAQKSQLLVKYLGNLALSNAKATYGPRITQNEVRLQLEELSPSQAMQDGTISEMLDKLGRISQYAIDSADRTRYYLAAQNGRNDPRDFVKWNQAHFPMAEATTPPAAGAHPADILDLLKKYQSKQ